MNRLGDFLAMDDGWGSGPTAAPNSLSRTSRIVDAWLRTQNGGVRFPEAVALSVREYLTRTVDEAFAIAAKFRYQTSRMSQGRESIAWREAFGEYCTRSASLIFQENGRLRHFADRVGSGVVASTAELLGRAVSDAELLRALGVESRSEIVELRFAGDRHAEGRVVCLVRFSTGANVVYKPRDVGPEVGWAAALDEFVRLGAPADLGAARVISRESYGWVEYIRPMECQPSEYSSLFHNLGGLVGLFYMLGSVDMHFENVISRSSRPYLIDCETLLGAMPFRDNAADYNIIWSGAVPWGPMAVDHGEVSLLGALAGTPRTVVADAFEMGRDGRMASFVGRSTYARSAAVPIGGNALQALVANVPVVCGGFEAMCKWFLSVRPELLTREPFLSIWPRSRFRVVLNNTVAYHKRMLSRIAANSKDETFLDLEERDMEAGDIPCFTVLGDGVSLEHSSGVTVGTAAVSAVAAAARHFSEIDDDNVAEQVRILSMALQERGRVTVRNSGLVRSDTVAWLLETSIPGDFGPTWLSLEETRDGREVIRPVGLGIHSGRSGMAVALGSVYSAFGDDRARELAVNLCDGMVCESMLSSDVSEICGTLYAIAAVKRLTGYNIEQPLLEEAWRRAEVVIRDACSVGTRNEPWVADFLFGLPGCVASLVAARALAPVDPTPLVRAMCSVLMERQVRDGEGKGGWVALNSAVAMTGFAHGACGVSYSLASAMKIVNDPDLLHAAIAGLEFERRFFDHSVGNWCDMRRWVDYSERDHKFMCGWCSGAPGAALARLVLAGVHAEINLDVSFAVTSILNAKFTENDSLCCGNLARAFALFEVGLSRSDAHLIASARSLVHKVQSRLNAVGAIGGGSAMGRGTRTHGLFSGETGLLYLRARVEAPNLVPMLWSDL